MSKDNPGSVDVLIIHHPPGMKLGCKHCGKIHLQGEYAVGLIVQEDGQEFRYALGIESTMWCCGEDKPFYQLFADPEDAQRKVATVREHLARHHTTDGLRLIGVNWKGIRAPSGVLPAAVRG